MELSSKANSFDWDATFREALQIWQEDTEALAVATADAEPAAASSSDGSDTIMGGTMGTNQSIPGQETDGEARQVEAYEKTLMWTDEKRRVMIRLDSGMDAFIDAVRDGTLQAEADKDTLDLFCELVGHRDATPLVKDGAAQLWWDHERGSVPESSTGMKYLLSRLEKPEALVPKRMPSASRLQELTDDMEPVTQDRLRRVLVDLAYLEEGAWGIDAAIPAIERKKLSQRLLHDIEYIEKEEFGLTRRPGDEFHIDEHDEGAARLTKLSQRIEWMWRQTIQPDQEADGPTPAKRQRR